MTSLREVVRLLLWHRRLVAALVTGATVAAALTVLAPRPAPTVTILVAARDLTGGTSVSADDVRTARFAVAVVPDGTLRNTGQATGRVLAGAVRRGEPLTDVRFVGQGLLAGTGSGSVATTVRLADAGAAALLRPGDRVDVLAAGATGAAVVASDVRVLAVPQSDDGGLVVVAVPPRVAALLAGVPDGARLSVTLRAP